MCHADHPIAVPAPTRRERLLAIRDEAHALARAVANLSDGGIAAGVGAELTAACNALAAVQFHLVLAAAQLAPREIESAAA